jgi:anti-sigma factor RsiW
VSSVHPPITEEDLHALVDGELDAPRLKQILTCLATVADHAKVDAWRQQNILLQAAFAPVTHEPMPLGLSLAPCVPRAKVLAAHPAMPLRPPKPSNRKPWALLAVGAALGLCLSSGEAFRAAFWPQDSLAPHRFLGSQDILGSQRIPGPQAADAESPPAAALGVVRALDRFLPPKNTAAKNITLKNTAAELLQSPDLSTIGLRLTGALVMTWNRGPIGCFNFLSVSEDRLVLCLVRRPPQPENNFQNIGLPGADVIGWQEATTFYALSGPTDANRLGEMAGRIHAALSRAAEDKKR